MRFTTLWLVTCIFLLFVADALAEEGASYVTGAGTRLPIMGSSVFGQAYFGVTFESGYMISTAVVGGEGNIDCVSPVLEGNNSTCTILPAANYHLISLIDNGKEQMESVIAGSYTVTSIFANHSIQVVFATDTFTVTPSAGPNGTLSPNSAQTVNYNDTKTFTITPDEGYIASVTGCGGMVIGNSYITGVITGNCTVTATFSVMPLRITGIETSYYDKLADAYATGKDGGFINIEALAVELPGNFVLDRNLSAFLRGGYAADFAGKGGYTTIRGTLVVKKGLLVLDGFAVR